MSASTRWSVVCAACVACAVLVIACATGGSSNRTGGGDDVVDPIDAAVTQKDANVTPMADAPIADAPKMIDGSVVVQDAAVTPDAPPSLFCSSNADCTAAGTCCFLSLCVNGTVILSQCFPGN